jgi:hypothetical protein
MSAVPRRFRCSAFPGRISRRWWLGLGGVALLSAAGGCAAYRFGNESLYPSQIETVYVPIFESTSYRRYLGERLTEAVIKQIQLKTPYKVVGDPSAADSVLYCKIVGETKRLVIENRYDDPRGLEANLSVQVRWTDHTDSLIGPVRSVRVPDELLTVSARSLLVPEMGQSVATAHQDAIHRLAVQIVGMMEKPW